MIRSFILSFVLVVSPFVFAQQTSVAAINFQELPLHQFLTYYFKHHIRENYVLSKELISNNTPVTVNLKGVPQSQYTEIFSNIFSSYGIKAEKKGDVWYVGLQERSSVPSSPLPVVHVDQQPSSVALPLDSASPAALPLPSVPLDTHVSVYLPRERSSEYLQAVANSLLNTQFPVSENVFLRGPSPLVEKVLSVLSQIDKAPLSVKINAYLVEFSDSSSSGRSFNLALNLLGSKLGIQIGGAPAGDNRFVFSNNSISAVLSAMDGDGRFRLMDSPSAVCDHGETCKVQAGNETPVLSSTTFDRDGRLQQQVTYRDSGSILEFTPLVMGDFVRVKMRQTVSAFSKNQTSGIDSPALMKRLIESTFSARPGDVVVLGGLDQDQATDSRSGLPFLPRALDSVSSTSARSQLLLFVELVQVRGRDSGSAVYDFPAVDLRDSMPTTKESEPHQG